MSLPLRPQDELDFFGGPAPQKKTLMNKYTVVALVSEGQFELTTSWLEQCQVEAETPKEATAKAAESIHREAHHDARGLLLRIDVNSCMVFEGWIEGVEVP